MTTIDFSRVPEYEPGKAPVRLDNITYDDELESVWGRRWGATTMIGKLRTVVVQRPGPEEADAELFSADPAFFNLAGHGIPGWRVASEPGDLPDLGRLRDEHDNYVSVLRAHGVDVLYADIPPSQRGPYAPLRAGFYPEPAVVRGGAVIPRTALAWKRGLEPLWTQALARLGVPIIYTVHGDGIFEGRIQYLDASTAMLGIGHRTNRSGAKQVENLLRFQGVEDVLYVDLPGNFLTHLCMAFSYVAHRVAVVCPAAVPYDILAYLRSRGIRLIEVPNEEMSRLAVNCIALEPGHVLMPAGSPRTKRALNDHGVEVLEVELDEIVKASGGPTCLTVALEREDGPSL